jgi:acyl carrier protein
MSDSGVRERLTRCLATYFTTLSAEEISQASMETVADWDSMAAVTLIAVVSEEFGIEVAADDYPKFVSFPSILDYLKKRQDLS